MNSLWSLIWGFPKSKRISSITRNLAGDFKNLRLNLQLSALSLN
jgi:hypothetical protein